MTDHLSARLTLLDAQLVDRERLPIGRIDDLELRFPAGGGAPEVSRILTGSEALGHRIGGALGRWMSSISARLRDPAQPAGPSAIDPALIAETEPIVRLRVSFDELDGVAGLERWLAANFVERLPGTGDAAE